MSDRDPDALDAVTNEDRFTVELEFVQSLANPRYVHFLASKGVLRDDRFIAYLRYLRYWERPEYAKFILYPHCLRFRRLLLDDAFRVGRAVQVVEVWAEAPDGASERLIGLAKLRGEELAAALDRERRRVVRAQRLFDVAAGADARLDEWLLDGGRAVVADFTAALVDPLSQLRRGAVDATLALGTPSQLAALEDARAFDKAAKIQSLLRARAARRRPAPPPPPPPAPAPAAPAPAPEPAAPAPAPAPEVAAPERTIKIAP